EEVRQWRLPRSHPSPSHPNPSHPRVEPTRSERRPGVARSLPERRRAYRFSRFGRLQALELGACVTADLWEGISRMDPKNATQMLALQLFLSFVEGIA